MARLPIPGSDANTWGAILNDFLSQAHKSNGFLKDGIVTSGSIQDSAITESKLDSDVQTKLNQPAPVTSVNAQTGDVVLDKADIGLGDVDNTADSAKPVSAAQQTALDAKLNATDLDAQTASNVTTNGTATQTAVASLVTSIAAVPAARVMHIGDTNGIFATSQSNGTDTGVNTLITHNIDTTIARPQFLFVNMSGTMIADGPNDITVRSALSSASVQVPIWFGGKRDVVIAPGASVWSDPVNIRLAAGSFRTRTRLLVNAGQTWYNTYLCTTASRAEGSVNDATAGATDLTLTGTISPSATYGYGPVAVRCLTTRADNDVVALVGDSITAGTGAAAPTFFNGFSRLACAAKGKVSINVGLGGSSAATGFGFTMRWRAAILEGATHAIYMYGTNDFGASTLAAIQGYNLNGWRDLAASGIRTYACTLPPRCTSTDSYTTLANQSNQAAGNATVRVPLNNWIRAGAPIDPVTLGAVAVGTPGALVAGDANHPLKGYFETADAVESSRDSCKWKVDGTTFKYTTDGVHPSAFGHNAMATAITSAWPTEF